MVPHGLAGEKVRIAGEVMPANLRPNNVNPFGDLYKLLSIGLPRADDPAAWEIRSVEDITSAPLPRLMRHPRHARWRGTGEPPSNDLVDRRVRRGRRREMSTSDTDANIVRIWDSLAARAMIKVPRTPPKTELSWQRGSSILSAHHAL
jgi:hypothetical protein